MHDDYRNEIMIHKRRVYVCIAENNDQLDLLTYDNWCRKGIKRLILDSEKSIWFGKEGNLPNDKLHK